MQHVRVDIKVLCMCVHWIAGLKKKAQLEREGMDIMFLYVTKSVAK